MTIFRGNGSPVAGGAYTPADGNFLVGDGTSWVLESGNTARTSLGVGNTDDVNHGSLTTVNGIIAGSTLAVGTNLTVGGTLNVTGASTLASLSLGTDLPVTEGGTGASTAADARTNLSLYSIAQVDTALASNSTTDQAYADATATAMAIALGG